MLVNERITINMVAGQRLKEARKKANLTQEQLASMLGIKAAEISQYESDKRTPRWPVFRKLLDILNISADEVLGREITVHDDEEYQIRLSKEELKIISCIKDNPVLYKTLLADPSRNVQLISNNIKKLIPEIDS